jgi:hypothetical protein
MSRVFGRHRSGQDNHEGKEEPMEADEKKKLAEEIGECAREYDMKYAG